MSKRQINKSTVAVVGGAGFLGSHLVDYLIEQRHCEVLVIDCLINGHRKYVHPKAKFHWCDIRETEHSLRSVFTDHKIEYLFNYAAEPYIPVSFKRPLHVFNINAFAMLKVMHAAQEAGVKAILQVSSAEIYGNVDGKIKESDPVIPHSSYGVSKVSADSFVQVRWREAQTPAIALRQFNCAGKRETHPYIIPEIIKQIGRRKEGKLTVRLGNNSFRDFLPAWDAVAMAVELLEKGEFGEVYNMGSEHGIQMYDLAKLIGRLMGVEVTVEVDEARKRPWEIWHLQSDNTKLFSVIDYRPKYGLEDALREAIKYYVDNDYHWDFEGNT